MTVFDTEAPTARITPRYNSARYAHNIYTVKPQRRVYCDPIMREGGQTPRSSEIMKLIGEMTVIFIFGAAMLGTLYTIYTFTSGGA
jgi:hypothetical protein